MTEDKKPKGTIEVDDEEFSALLDQVPLRVIDNRAELNYYSNPKPSVSDTLEFLQCIMKTGRILEFSKQTLKIAESLFRQGLLFRHSKGAIQHDATRYSKEEERQMKELAESCDCPDCRGSK